MNMGTEYRTGTTNTTTIGYINVNKQKNHGTRGVSGTDHGQVVYKLECMNCGHEYGANGTDIFQRKCPKCQSGMAGLDY
jgi:predicted Zn-ribbon and HTH transcriptional regulator